MAADMLRTEDIDALRAQSQAQASEIERLQRLLEDSPNSVSRRDVVKGFGLGGLGGLVALGAATAGIGGSAPALALPAESSDLAGELPAILKLKMAGKD